MKRKWKDSYHCDTFKVNIIKKQSYCKLEHNSNCDHCSHKQLIDHSHELNLKSVINEANTIIKTSNGKREEIFQEIKKKYSLDLKQSQNVKRHLTYNF